MDILTLFVVLPVLTIIALFLTKNPMAAKKTAMVGSIVQLGMALHLLWAYFKERNFNTGTYVFTRDVLWFEPLNIHYAIGVDAVSVFMILLTAIVVLAGVFISWKVDDLPKEFFISLIVLSTGVYGFFISIDLFTLFVFYELAVIPMYLLIGIWGSGPREFSAMKLTLMLMGASAVLLVGILGVYFNSATDGAPYTFNLLEIAAAHLPFEVQKLFFPFLFIGFAVIGALFPFHTWSPDGHASAPTAVSMLHAGVLMKLGGYGVFRVAMFLLPEGTQYWSWFFYCFGCFWRYLRCFCRYPPNRSQIHQRLFVGEPFGHGALCIADAQPNSVERCITPIAFPRLYDRLVFCAYRYDLRPYPHPKHYANGRFAQNHTVYFRGLCHSRTCLFGIAGF